MKTSGGKAGLFLRRFPLIGPMYQRQDRLRARVGLLRKRIKAVEAAATAKLKRVEAAGAAKLKAVKADSAAKLEAITARNDEAERQLAILKRRRITDARAAIDPDLRVQFLEFLQCIAPRRVVGHVKTRVGGTADGGYVMLDDFAGVRTAISGGIGDNVSWDLAIGERGIDVIQVDHSVEGPPVRHPRFDFRKQRLVETCQEPHDVTLSSLIASCPGDDQSILCKLDIEGGEWDVFAEPVDGLGRCRQILIEFHRLSKFSTPEWRSRAMNCLEQITARHQCIHVHGNNAFSPPFTVLGGIPFPSIFEATFVQRDRYVFEEETDTFPTPIDAPNRADCADLLLGVFPRPVNEPS